MANEVENYSGSITEIPAGTTLLDMTNPGTPESLKMEAKHIIDMLVVASELAQDMGSTTTGNVIPLIWRCSSQDTRAVIIEITNITSGKAPSTLTVQIGSSSGGNDIMLAETLEGTFADSSWFFHINGVVPRMLSDSDTYFLKIVQGATNEYTGDIFIHAITKDV